jgi:uncharacterized protein
MRTDHGRRSKEVITALGQLPAGASLAELSELLDAAPSSVQRAVESLMQEGLVGSTGIGRQRRYSISGSGPTATAFSEYALHSLPVRDALAIAARANEAIEFAGLDRDGLFLVHSPFAEASDVIRFNRVARTLVVDHEGKGIDAMDRHDLRERMLDDRSLLERARRLNVLKGSVARSFPSPRRRGSFAGRRLGRIHDSLRLPSRRSIESLARRNGLRRVAIFGSAVREDFRPDSDVDVLAESKAGESLSIHRLMDIQRELEPSFGRHVDVVNVAALRPDVRARIEADQVPLYG